MSAKNNLVKFFDGKWFYISIYGDEIGPFPDEETAEYNLLQHISLEREFYEAVHPNKEKM